MPDEPFEKVLRGRLNHIFRQEVLDPSPPVTEPEKKEPSKWPSGEWEWVRQALTGSVLGGLAAILMTHFVQSTWTVLGTAIAAGLLYTVEAFPFRHWIWRIRITRKATAEARTAMHCRRREELLAASQEYLMAVYGLEKARATAARNQSKSGVSRRDAGRAA